MLFLDLVKELPVVQSASVQVRLLKALLKNLHPHAVLHRRLILQAVKQVVSHHKPLVSFVVAQQFHAGKDVHKSAVVIS